MCKISSKVSILKIERIPPRIMVNFRFVHGVSHFIIRMPWMACAGELRQCARNGIQSPTLLNREQNRCCWNLGHQSLLVAAMTSLIHHSFFSQCFPTVSALKNNYYCCLITAYTCITLCNAVMHTIMFVYQCIR